MTHSDLTPIQQLWLNTLVANKSKLGDMRAHWRQVNIVEHPGQITHLMDYVIREGLIDIRVTYLQNFARIEQQEMMQYILAAVHEVLADRFEVEMPRNAQDLGHLCTILRCVPTNDALPDVRWRKMGMLFYRHELPYADLENRPICGICHGRVATGAGAQGDQTVTTRAGGTREVTYRPDVHNECYRYAKLILVPALKLQREQAGLKQTAEVDK